MSACYLKNPLFGLTTNRYTIKSMPLLCHIVVILLSQVFCLCAEQKKRPIQEYPYEHAFSVLFMPDQKYPYFQSMPFGYQPNRAINSALWHAELTLLLYNKKNFILSQLQDLQVNVTYYDAPHTDTQAILIKSINNCHAIFRGTETFNLKDTLTDSLFWTTDWQGGGNVHRGFQRAIDDLLQATSISADLRKCENLTMAGHSLGAALATLAADIIPGVQKIYSFGAPRVGDENFVKNHNVKTLRYVHATDIVSFIPIRSIGYQHSTAITPLKSQHKYPAGISWNLIKKKIFLPIMDHAMVFYCLAFNDRFQN